MTVTDLRDVIWVANFEDDDGLEMIRDVGYKTLEEYAWPRAVGWGVDPEELLVRVKRAFVRETEDLLESNEFRVVWDKIEMEPHSWVVKGRVTREGEDWDCVIVLHKLTNEPTLGK